MCETGCNRLNQSDRHDLPGDKAEGAVVSAPPNACPGDFSVKETVFAKLLRKEKEKSNEVEQLNNLISFIWRHFKAVKSYLFYSLFTSLSPAPDLLVSDRFQVCAELKNKLLRIAISFEAGVLEQGNICKMTGLASRDITSQGAKKSQSIKIYMKIYYGRGGRGSAGGVVVSSHIAQRLTIRLGSQNIKSKIINFGIYKQILHRMV